MNLPGTRRVRLVCLCAFASWSALSPAIGVLPSNRAALAADAACAVPAPVSLSMNAASPVASPIASPVASPVAGATPVAAEGAPVDPATASAVEQVVRTVAACETSADYQTMAQLVTPTFLSHVYGGGLPLTTAQFVELGKSLPPAKVTVASVGDARQAPDGSVSADVVLVAAKQVKHARWSFVATPTSNAGDSTGGETGASSGLWQVNDVAPLPVTVAADAQSFAVTITSKGFSPASLAAKKGADLVLNASNQDKQDHELLVLRLGKGMTTADLLLATGPALPKGVDFIGQVTIPAQTEGQLVLTEMPRDRYVIVDMLPDADGVPFLSGGFQMTLTVS